MYSTRAHVIPGIAFEDVDPHEFTAAIGFDGAGIDVTANFGQTEFMYNLQGTHLICYRFLSPYLRRVSLVIGAKVIKRPDLHLVDLTPGIGRAPTLLPSNDGYQSVMPRRAISTGVSGVKASGGFTRGTTVLKPHSKWIAYGEVCITSLAAPGHCLMLYIIF